MEKVSFDRLLLKTAFCCMASDGKIHESEIIQIKKMYEASPLFRNINFHNEINELITKLNNRGLEFIEYYFDLLSNSSLTEDQELMLIDFAVKTIHSDGIDEYAEIKFFRNIRHRISLSDAKILAYHPEVEYWLEEDITASKNLDKLTYQYLSHADIPQFEFIKPKSET